MKNIIDPTKLPYRPGDIIHSCNVECTGIIVGYYFCNRFNSYSEPSMSYGYVVKRLDNKIGHNGNYISYKPNGEKLESSESNLYCIPSCNEITIMKSLGAFIFKLLKT